MSALERELAADNRPAYPGGQFLTLKRRVLALAAQVVRLHRPVGLRVEDAQIGRRAFQQTTRRSRQ